MKPRQSLGFFSIDIGTIPTCSQGISHRLSNSSFARSSPSMIRSTSVLSFMIE